MYPQDYDKFTIRFPNGWRDTLKMKAAENQRSMNSEILFHLRQAYGLQEADYWSMQGGDSFATKGATGGNLGGTTPVTTDHTDAETSGNYQSGN